MSYFLSLVHWWNKGILLVACAFLTACALEPVGPERPEKVLQLELPAFTPSVGAAQAKQLGLNAFSAGDFPVAVRYFQSTVEQSPQDLDAWLGLGASADRAGQFEISAAAYARFLELAGPSIEYYNNRGFSFLLQGRLFDARSAFRAGLKLAPNNTTLKNNLKLVDKLEGRGPVGRAK